MEHRLITDSLLACRLGVKVAALREEADAGRLPHVKVGARYLFDAALVERTLLTRMQPQKAKGEAP